ncbi:glycosyltransferase family 2 protein [Pinibacter soli]|uniref:Glycosyltransferase family A protein n=1 Tax=Pinibacter soli TaxID=3044211 RepID=A0ABT6R913_9BACT|nr:glycosyltransferase family A protein [Pinibacter soli]MDI3319042.1 glycosyltransferase family A protein [Pinibacter soli]
MDVTKVQPNTNDTGNFYAGPLISVIIPVFNASQTIERTLASIENQTYKNFEVILVDDGSTDDSSTIITRYIAAGESSSNISYRLLHQTNKGVSAARNAGLRNATGVLLALLDADDEWLSDKTEKQLNILQNNPHIDLIGTNFNDGVIFLPGYAKTKKSYPVTLKQLLYKNFFATPTIIFKREIIEKDIFFDEGMKFMEDQNYWMRICLAGFSCAFLNENLVIAGNGKPPFGHAGLSSNLPEMEKGELYNLRHVYKNNGIGFVEYNFLKVFSTLKFFRRLFISNFRKNV